MKKKNGVRVREMHGPNPKAAGSLKQEKLRKRERGDGKRTRDTSVVGGVCGALPGEIDEMWGQGDSEGKKKRGKKVLKNNRLLGWVCATKLTHLHGSLGCQIGRSREHLPHIQLKVTVWIDVL